MNTLPRLLHFLAYAFVLACTGMPVPAASATAAAREPYLDWPIIDQLHTSWTAREGAPPNINAIAQTPDGWLWIGSASGLYKFDGVRFQRAAGPEAPLSTTITSMGVLDDGRLWVGYRFGGISLLEGGRMRHFPAGKTGLPMAAPRSVVADATGRLWLATDGLYYFDTQWRPADAAFGFPPGRVHALALDRRGVLWVSCETGVFALPKGAARFERRETWAGYGTLVRHPDGSVWTNDRDFGKVHLLAAPDRGPAAQWDKSVNHTLFMFDHEGAMWMGTVVGVARAWPAGMRMPAQITRREHGLSGSKVSTVFEDREQNIWVGTESGLDRFRKPRLQAIPLPAYRLSPAGPPIAGGPGGSAWIERFALAGPDAVPQPFAPDSDKTISALYRDRDGTLFGGGDDQLWTLGKAGRQPIARPPGMPANALVLAMARGRDGALWVNFGVQGLYKWADGHWSRPQGVLEPGATLSALVADAQGRLWFGYRKNRLARLEDGSMRFFGAADGLSTGTVAQIVPVGGQAWIGGEGGLAYFDGKRFTAIRGRNDEVFPGITGLVIDRQGDLWINGSNGISRIANSELRRALASPGYPVHFGRLDYRDGLAGAAPPVYPTASAAISENGTLWFSTTGGVYAFDPATLPRNTLAPPVSITGLRYGGALHAPAEGARLPPGTAMLQVEFTALSYQAPERMAFRYRLEGVDPGWRDSTGERAAYYTNLGPGRYRFRVTASNNDGVWNEEGASIAFEIAPSLTQTLWFRTLCAAALAGLLAALYFWRTRLLARRYDERLRERLAERERIARALHDTLLQSMQGLVLRFHGIAKRLPAGDGTRASIETVLDQADDLLADGRKEVLNLRSRPAPAAEVAEALSEFGLSLQQTFGPTCSVTVTGKPAVIDGDAWREIFSIGREALFNAYRHANARQVAVYIVYAPDALSLTVRDDGAGIGREVLAAGRKEGHWGLAGMKERAQALGGSLELRNREGGGAEVALRVPARSAYLA